MIPRHVKLGELLYTAVLGDIPLLCLLQTWPSGEGVSQGVTKFKKRALEEERVTSNEALGVKG